MKLLFTLISAALAVSSPANSWASDPNELIIGTDDLYGFTSGSDIGDARARAIGFGSTWAIARRAGRFGAGVSNLDFRYNLSDDVQIGLGVSADSFSIRDVPGLADRNQISFSGVTPSFRWRIIERSLSPGHPTQGGPPFGLTLSIESRVGRLFSATGERAHANSVEARLSLDAALVPSYLYGAVNLSYEGESVRLAGLVPFAAPGGAAFRAYPEIVGLRRASTEEGSTLGVSAALTYQVATGYFFGAEIRYRRAYEGLTFRSLAGQALFIGPTVFVDLGNERTLSAAWSAQVAGKAEGSPGKLDLNNFTRHEARLTLRFGF